MHLVSPRTALHQSCDDAVRLAVRILLGFFAAAALYLRRKPLRRPHVEERASQVAQRWRHRRLQVLQGEAVCASGRQRWRQTLQFVIEEGE
jgi:hypothetical protein